MGTIAVLRYAAGNNDGIEGVVTVSCPARWTLPRNARGVFSACLVHTRVGRRFSARRLGVRIAKPGPRGLAPVELVRQLTVPLAVVHGSADPFIPADDAALLHGAAAAPAALHVVEGRWHAYDPVARGVIVAAVDWIMHGTAPQPPATPR